MKRVWSVIYSNKQNSSSLNNPNFWYFTVKTIIKTCTKFHFVMNFFPVSTHIWLYWPDLDSSCHFWNQKVRVYSNFALQFRVMKDNSSAFFELKPHTLDKNSPLKWNFWTSEWLGESLKPKVSFSLNFASLFNVMRDRSSVIF